MATTTAFIFTQGQHAARHEPRSGYATIDSGETTTLPIPCHGRGTVRLGFPSNFDGATASFLVQAFPPADPASPTVSPPFRQLVDRDGTAITVTVTDDSMVEVPQLSGCYAFEIVSASTESPAAVIEVQMTGEPIPFEASSGGGSSTATADNPNVATFVKPNVTTAGSSGAWTTANSPITVATVTGIVGVRVFGVVTTSITSTGGTGTLSLTSPALAGGTAATLIAASTANGTTQFAAGSLWVSSTPLTGAGQPAPASSYLALNATTIQLLIATNNMTAGGMTIYFLWYPITDGATLTVATP